MTFIIFIAFGAAVGWLLNQRGRGAAYGPIADMAIGALGGLIGGWLFTEVGIPGAIGFIVSLIVAIVAAGILVSIIRMIKPGVVAG